MRKTTAHTNRNPRLRRLWSDYMSLNEMVSSTDLIKIAPAGDPPDRYRVLYRCRGLVAVTQDGAPELSTRHICDIYLHRDYPQRPPRMIWRTPVFHPNIMPPARGGAVCIGGWSPGESLPDLVLRIGEMIQYKNYDLDDVLNEAVVAWVQRNADHFPVDDTPLAPGH